MLSSLGTPTGTGGPVLDQNITHNDVLCGVDADSQHPGNKRFQKLVRHFEPRYAKATNEAEKIKISRAIVQAVRNAKWAGRFLQRYKVDGRWYELGDEQAWQATSRLLLTHILKRKIVSPHGGGGGGGGGSASASASASGIGGGGGGSQRINYGSTGGNTGGSASKDNSNRQSTSTTPKTIASKAVTAAVAVAALNKTTPLPAPTAAAKLMTTAPPGTLIQPKKNTIPANVTAYNATQSSTKANSSSTTPSISTGSAGAGSNKPKKKEVPNSHLHSVMKSKDSFNSKPKLTSKPTTKSIATHNPKTNTNPSIQQQPSSTSAAKPQTQQHQQPRLAKILPILQPRPPSSSMPSSTKQPPQPQQNSNNQKKSSPPSKAQQQQQPTPLFATNSLLRGGGQKINAITTTTTIAPNTANATITTSKNKNTKKQTNIVQKEDLNLITTKVPFQDTLKNEVDKWVMDLSPQTMEKLMDVSRMYSARINVFCEE